MKKIYTEEHKEYLRAVSFGKTNKEITELFNKKFRLNKTESQIKSLRLKTGGCLTRNTGRFEKGMISANKGKKYPGKTNVTSFKKGHVPANYREIGSTRISKDGYQEIKISKNKWKFTHNVIYEKHYGKIPKDSMIKFIDNDKTNLDINNLVLIKKSVNMRMNQKKWYTNKRDINESRILLVKVNEKIKNVKNKK
ncbi:HNH endonuclease signature motif containing protein [Helcococcus ovis]|uniref:HNH endonuclease signature motif containing protein n=1 Tax=Helcococcus TaxID=31983 RepID=UPI0038B78769